MPRSRRYGSVILDCDSTLSVIEGIDQLAHAHREEIARLTELAMRGEVALEAVYGRRLDLARPTRAQIDALGERYVQTLVTDARETVAALLGEGIEVRVMSGGIRQAVLALALALGLGEQAVAAVDVYFDSNGEYAGFEPRRRWRDPEASAPFSSSGFRSCHARSCWSVMAPPISRHGRQPTCSWRSPASSSARRSSKPPTRW